MATAPPTGLRLGAIAPQDAVAAFQARGLLQPTFRWQDMWNAEHARAFTVAGVMRLDVLRLIQQEMADAVSLGKGMEEVGPRLKRQLVAKGFWGDVEVTDPSTGELRTTKFNDARLRLIFDVNMRQSHAAGRWARASRGRMPYLVYRTMRDEKVRASHRPWDNVVLPRDHPWWDTHYPPNGWRCRCTAFAVDEAGLEQLRRSAPKDAPVRTEPPPTTFVEFTNRSTGQVELVPRGIDPGFAYNAGKAHVQRAAEMLQRGLNAMPATLPGAGDAMAMTRAVVARTRSEKPFGRFLERPPKLPPGQQASMPVAAVPAAPGEPRTVSVSAADLLAQARTADYPRQLPIKAAGWALAQAIADQGQRLDLEDGRVLWWWLRGAGSARRVLVLEMTRSPLTWWVQQLATLTPDEALARYPRLEGLV